MAWIKRHKVWSGILAWLVVCIIGGVIDSVTGTTNFAGGFGYYSGFFGGILFLAWAIWGRKKKG